MRAFLQVTNNRQQTDFGGGVVQKHSVTSWPMSLPISRGLPILKDVFPICSENPSQESSSE